MTSKPNPKYTLIMKQYFYAELGADANGPVSLEQLVAAGVTGDTLVWNEEMPDWEPARNVPEVWALIMPPAPPVAPPPVASDRQPIPVPPPAPAPVVEPAPAPVVEPAPAPMVEPAPAPVVEPAPAPVVEPAPAPVVEPAPAPVAEPAPAPVVEPAPAPVVEPAPAPVVEPAPAPVVEPAPIPTNVVPAANGGGGGNKLWLWILLGVVGLAILGGGLYFLLNGFGKSEKKAPAAPKTMESPMKADTAASVSVKPADLWATLANPSLTFAEVDQLHTLVSDRGTEVPDTLKARIDFYWDIANDLRKGDIDSAVKHQTEAQQLLPTHGLALMAAFQGFVEGADEVEYTPAAAAKAKEIFKVNASSYKSFADIAAIASHEEVRKAQEAPTAAPTRPAPRKSAAPVRRTTTTPASRTVTPGRSSNGLRNDVRRQFDRARRGY